ncbi:MULTISPECIES: DUF805 domain-containing protein [Brevibacillus]|uniref:DUF805 domain-containing protein n=1 Tax=Brevibacillus TaxID=55080 RepID=UPI000D10AF47|nr:MULTISPECIES: DUF805 domain-containing protein [Brevibacillus]PSJ71335.1 DUF805 domain-containing protein [Brevibacillus brevis]RED28946.1 uncharacterized membrane protein YhaH (DUF805 family) [Brevibacillus brevis]TQK61933.1 uncharacterized membrane protein YhaH (DUF805 family) [Brevibacillus sp. AG162]VEF91459.1 Inner membrane protein yhaI [Brevibacillus brevis]GEC90245.1 DUF805 domain-containing protein [Brevibacillus brevis]
MHWYTSVLKKYVAFTGRARRQEYWMFTLFNIIVSLVIALVDSLLGTASVLGLIYSLAVLLPSLSVTARRLHDTGRSGWWILLSFIPFIGAIILIVFLCQDSQGDNQYGANPKSSQSF